MGKRMNLRMKTRRKYNHISVHITCLCALSIDWITVLFKDVFAELILFVLLKISPFWFFQHSVACVLSCSPLSHKHLSRNLNSLLWLVNFTPVSVAAGLKFVQRGSIFSLLISVLVLKLLSLGQKRFHCIWQRTHTPWLTGPLHRGRSWLWWEGGSCWPRGSQ